MCLPLSVWNRAHWRYSHKHPDRQIAALTGNALQIKEEWGSEHHGLLCTATLLSCFICTVPLISICTIIRWLGGDISGPPTALLSANMNDYRFTNSHFSIQVEYQVSNHKMKSKSSLKSSFGPKFKIVEPKKINSDSEQCTESIQVSKMTQKHHMSIIKVVYMTFARYQNLLKPYDGFAWGPDGYCDWKSTLAHSSESS